jgi:hypothetical protein
MHAKIQALSNAITSRAGRQILKVQSKSPAILFAAGVVGVVGTVVLACRATLKLDDVFTEHQETQLKMEFAAENIVDYTEEMHQRDKLVLLAKTSGRIAKLYLPTVAVGLVSICALTGSHIILSRRNLGLTAAYAALDKGFRQYRERVVNELGKDKDDEFRYGFQTREVAEDTDTGVVVKTVRSYGKDEPSVYAKIFDEGCLPWEKSSESNRIFLQCQQNYFNQRLQAKGHVFLNEVYRALGIPETKAGQSVGWALGKGRDNYISFGIFEGLDDERIRAFVNGNERSVLLDFNVDGPILGVLEQEI